MRRGFTLIELLAVIVIMGIILGIAVPSVINVIEKSKRNAWNSQKEIIMKALDNYLLLNNDNISWDNNYVYYSIEDLVNIGIIESNIKVPDNYSLDEVTVKLYKDNQGKAHYLITTPSDFQAYLNTTFKYNGFYFVGANPNNWIEFGQVSSGNSTPILWRIVKYDDEGIKIIYEGTKNGSNPPVENGFLTMNGEPHH